MTEKAALDVTRNRQKSRLRVTEALDVWKYHMSELAPLCLGTLENVRQSYLALKDKGGADTASVCAEACACAFLCKRICELLSERGEGLKVTDFLQHDGDDGDGLIAYMKNAVTDEAYRIFSAYEKGASVTYPSGFAAACEDVYYGRAGYCILPYETSEDGTLSGFGKLIRKYELYPLMACSVPSENGVTKLALLGKNPYSGRLRAAKGRRMLKLTFDSFSEGDPVGLLSAAKELGHRLLKTESAPVSWDSGRYALSFTFEITGDATAFLLYIALEQPECTYKAIYTEV